MICGIYKYVWHDEIVYIGKADKDIMSRIVAHKSESKFQPYLKDCVIWYTECVNPAHTTILETYLINKYKPRLNVSMKYADALPIEINEPSWSLLVEETPIVKKPRKLHQPYNRSWTDRQLKDIKRLRHKIAEIKWLETILPNYEGQVGFEVEVPAEIHHGGDCYFSLSIADRPDFYGWNIAQHCVYYPDTNTLKAVFLGNKEDIAEVDFWNNYPNLLSKTIENYELDIYDIVKALKRNGLAIAASKSN